MKTVFSSLRWQVAVPLVVALSVAALLNLGVAAAAMRLVELPPGPAATAATMVPGASPAPSAGVAPRARRQALRVVASYSLLNTLLALGLGLVMLQRRLARPLERVAEAAERIGRLELDAPLEAAAFPGELGPAFEQMAKSLKQERARVAQQIQELQQLNAQLRTARESLAGSERLATVGRLAAGVAHEIGNPLGAILGYLELARGKAPPAVAEHLERIDREIARIDRTVRELLAFSRPGEPEAPLEPLALREAVEAAARLSAMQKRLRGVRIELEVPDSLKVMADPHRLSQVLVNLLLNAGDAMGGEGRVTVSARRLPPGPGGRRAGDPPPVPRVELTVADTGPGIPEQDLARVFDPFFTTKQPGEGTGLGLSICHRIMEGFGGSIAAGNRPDGSGALLTLVFREVAADAARPHPPREDARCPSTTS